MVGQVGFHSLSVSLRLRRLAEAAAGGLWKAFLRAWGWRCCNDEKTSLQPSHADFATRALEHVPPLSVSALNGYSWYAYDFASDSALSLWQLGYSKSTFWDAIEAILHEGVFVEGLTNLHCSVWRINDIQPYWSESVLPAQAENIRGTMC